MKKKIQIKLDNKRRYIKSNSSKDFTLIEIIPSDKIEKNYFLLPNINVQNNNLINSNIYIIQFPLGNELSHSEGKIIKIDDYKLYYDASTKEGSSGSPIILKDSTKVIGLHKGYFKGTNESNCGILIESIIQSLQSKNLDDNFTEFYENGDYYLGQGLDGKRHGNGILFDKDGNIKYQGTFKNGKFLGDIKLSANNEDEQEEDINNFIKEKFESIGQYVDEYGISYKGPWLNGKKHGKGREYYKNGMLKYDGEFVDDKYEGDGIFYYENRDYYIGKFSNGQKSGRGIEYYENGDPKYEGEFALDKYEGIGKYYDTNGDTYKGKFFDGKFSGVIFDKDGNIKNKKKSIFPEFVEGDCKIF